MPRQDRVIDLNPYDDSVPDPPPSGAGEQLTAYVRAIYVGCFREFTGDMHYGRGDMPQWDGGEDSFGRRHRSIWMRVAEKILAGKYEPISYIRAQFWCRRNDSRPPPPTYLLSDEAAARYGVYLLQAPAVARQELEAALRTIQGEVLLLTTGLGWEYERALRYKLRDVTSVRSSALIRYCYSCQHGFSDYADHFHDQALLQYVFQQEVLDQVWGDFIPAPLREEAAKLRASFLGGH